MRNTHILSVAPPCFANIGDDQCTGCAACANGCPRSAIEIKLNCEGFYRPVLREELCNDCKTCLHHCPVLTVAKYATPDDQTSDAPDVYAAWSTNEYVHLASSSGGIFSELARYVLDRSGVVCGCEWGENWTPRHVLVSNWADLSKLRGSKYIPSFIDERFYREIIELAKTGTAVLFCGTPCQVAGLDLITPPAARSNIILVEVVCHGVPSLTSFWSYIDWRFGGRDSLTNFTFRNKEISVQTICAITNSGDKYLMECSRDPWFRAAMVYHLFLQRSCYGCRFSTLPRWADLTLGDFWGIPPQWHNPLGDSVVFANTEKGKDLLHLLIKDNRISVKQTDYATASRKSPRLRAAIYYVPVLRSLSLRLIMNGVHFVWFYLLFYRPLSFGDRLLSFARRRLLLLSQLWHQK